MTPPKGRHAYGHPDYHTNENARCAELHRLAEERFFEDNPTLFRATIMHSDNIVSRVMGRSDHTVRVEFVDLTDPSVVIYRVYAKDLVPGFKRTFN